MRSSQHPATPAGPETLPTSASSPHRQPEAEDWPAPAAVAHALSAGMLPQWLARALGFSELGTQIRVQLIRDAGTTFMGPTPDW